MKDRKAYAATRRWVVKIGSSLVTNDGRGLDEQAIDLWVDQIAALHAEGKRFVVVSSGAVAAGLVRLGWKKRPVALNEMQASAAVGQMTLVQAWERSFQRYGLHTAQVLLTYADLTDRHRYLNARSTLRTLLKLGVIPVVNENDTVSTEELQFGDNDTLASLVSNLVEAELLVILTDQAGLFEEDPRRNPEARLISEADAGDQRLLTMATPTPGMLGRGGMQTKVSAASRAARAGAATLIAGGRDGEVLQRIARGEVTGTLLRPDREPLAARKQWINGHLRPGGKLVVDDGAARVLRKSGRSLLAVGVTAVEGDFGRGDVVACCDSAGAEIARGLVNYNADEIRRIMGQPTARIQEILGYLDQPEVVHRDNMVIT